MKHDIDHKCSDKAQQCDHFTDKLCYYLVLLCRLPKWSAWMEGRGQSREWPPATACSSSFTRLCKQQTDAQTLSSSSCTVANGVSSEPSCHTSAAACHCVHVSKSSLTRQWCGFCLNARADGVLSGLFSVSWCWGEGEALLSRMWVFFYRLWRRSAPSNSTKLKTNEACSDCECVVKKRNDSTFWQRHQSKKKSDRQGGRC